MRLPRPDTHVKLSATLAVLRVVSGVVFAAHGAQKLFSVGLAGVGAGFAQMGVPLAGVVGPAVALLEFFGGIALIVGLFTRLSAVGLAIIMLGAIFLVHLSGGFFLPSGYEFAFLLFGTATALALAGAGDWSLDARLAGRRSTGRQSRTSR